MLNVTRASDARSLHSIGIAAHEVLGGRLTTAGFEVFFGQSAEGLVFCNICLADEVGSGWNTSWYPSDAGMCNDISVANIHFVVV